MSVEQINAKIAVLKNELSSVKGTECEVYARIVGYYRSVKNWNAGKSEEYKHRLNFQS
jgi:anaerobic ribonucleoside-triphosphate reductase